MSAARYDAVVIGGGANGLVAAATLARKLRRVLVLERADGVGGMSRLFEIAPGFRAPLALDCGWVAPSVAASLGSRLPPSTAPETAIAIRAAGGFLAIPARADAAADVIRPLSARDADRWPALVSRLRRWSDFLGTLYESPPPDVAARSLSDLASLAGLGRRALRLGRSEVTELLRVLPMSIQDFAEDELEHPTLHAALASGAVRDLRQGPRSGGTLFNLLHGLVGAAPGSVRALPWWSDGPDAFVRHAEQVARKRGVEIRTGTEVARIDVADHAVRGVTLANGDEIATTLVISTADPRTTLLQLADPLWLDPEVLHSAGHIKMRGCTSLVLYGLGSLPAAAGLAERDLAGVVSLSAATDVIERAYDAVKYGRASAVPHVELSVLTLRWPALAPEGRHVVLARAQYAPTDGSSREAFADVVTRVIDDAMPGFAARVRHRRAFLPSDLSAELGLAGGAMTHGELTLDQVLYMRPIPGYGRYALPVEGLYLGGAGAHPGPGVPGAPGRLAARAALG